MVILKGFDLELASYKHYILKAISGYKLLIHNNLGKQKLIVKKNLAFSQTEINICTDLVRLNLLE